MRGRKSMKSRLLSIVSLATALLALPGDAQDELSSFAFVQPDGTLKLDGELIHLYGILIPPTGQTCAFHQRPLQCGPRAALALDFRISGDFVHCQPLAANADDSLVARCLSGAVDLSAWMLQRGWAVALPDAPDLYRTLENIARAQGVGIWGIPVERRGQRH
jgi:endonuclease YncB( thermonuclease family)